jgi:hypothetical protein
MPDMRLVPTKAAPLRAAKNRGTSNPITPNGLAVNAADRSLPTRRTFGTLAMRRLLLPVFTTVVFAAFLQPAAARNSNFDPRIITFGESREEIKNTPMVDRPYRPLHVYGNSVRRRHGRSAPRPQGQR